MLRARSDFLSAGRSESVVVVTKWLGDEHAVNVGYSFFFVFEFSIVIYCVCMSQPVSVCETTSDQYWQAYIRSTSNPITLPPY